MRDTPTSVLDKIQEAKEKQLKELDLSRNELTEIPDSITQLENLTWLDLSGNKLTEIPDSIGIVRFRRFRSLR